ncbi:MAG: MarC family NAAT transporter [Saprospiraceae bacterium]|jgi:multiple antibiotic resistance protein|nr:MarC family NAAT transporter [Saprospiraceae bacterium]MBP9193927.1 MarC family NAAT transporter [Saprospiraceae bacterium]
MFVAVFASLISVVNPLGAVPLFLALSKDHTARERAITARQTSIYFTLILLAFFLAGSMILSFFGININAMRAAGGLIILASGYSLLSGKFEQHKAVDQKVRQEAMHKSDISFSPMAMPMLSGPGSISLLIGYYTTYADWWLRLGIMGVIVLCGVVVYFILKMAPALSKLLGEGGLKAISRIMGFIVMSIGIQYIINGGVALFRQAML